MNNETKLITWYPTYDELKELIDERRLYVAPPTDSLRLQIMDVLPSEMHDDFVVGVLVKAVQRDYIHIHDSYLEWTLGTKTTLVYFLGRVFANDFYTYDKVKKANVWKNGNKRFPAKQLERIFAQRYLREIRKNRYLETIPQNAEQVDELFV